MAFDPLEKIFKNPFFSVDDISERVYIERMNEEATPTPRTVKVVRHYARIPGSPTKGEDRVKITSRFSPTQVYVARLVKSTGKFGKRRYLIDLADIREEVQATKPVAPAAPATAKVTVISIWSKDGPDSPNPSYEVTVPRGKNEAKTLDAAFALTNRDDRPKRTEVCSTSAGDILVLDGTSYFVDWVGFKALTPAQAEAVQKLTSRDTGMGWEWLVQRHLVS